MPFSGSQGVRVEVLAEAVAVVEVELSAWKVDPGASDPCAAGATCALEGVRAELLRRLRASLGGA